MCVGVGVGGVEGGRCCGDRLKKYLGVVIQLDWAESPASYGKSDSPVTCEPWTRLGILESYLC